MSGEEFRANTTSVQHAEFNGIGGPSWRLRDNGVLSLRRAIDTDGRVHSRFNPARSFSGQIVNSNPDLGRVPGRTSEMARIRGGQVASLGSDRDTAPGRVNRAAGRKRRAAENIERARSRFGV
jgi:hypothetical protein